ncbi:MAG: hypothetical protein R3A52_13320 [Polyangiales bacterium]
MPAATPVESVATGARGVPATSDLDRDGLFLTLAGGARRAEARDRPSPRSTCATTAGDVVRADVSLPRDGDPSRGRDFVRLTVVRRWPSPPRALSLRCAFVGEHPVSVFASRAAATEPGRLSLLGRPEMQAVASPAARLELLRSPAPPAPAAPRPSPAPYYALGLASAVAVVLWRRRSTTPTTDGATT